MAAGSGHFEYCASKLREENYGRYLCTLYLPASSRGAAQALFAFDREVHNIAHRVSQPLPGEVRIQWWRDTIATGNKASLNPIANALLDVIDSNELSLEKFDQLLEAWIFDLYNDPMPDREALEVYLGQTRSWIIQQLAEITLSSAGEDVSAVLNHHTTTASGHAGIVIGMAEILTDLAFDFHHQKQFVPKQLSSHEMTIREGGRETLNLKWLNDVIEYCLDHHSSAQDAIDQLPKEIAIVYLPLTLAHGQLLVMKNNKPDLYKKLAQPSKFKTHLTLWRAVWRLKDSGSIF